jgi:tetratricopeptide (TPR) repeat protein
MLLVVATLVVYGRILGHDFIFNWDDSFYIIDNEAIQGLSFEHFRTVFSSYYVGNYSPVQMLSYMLDHSLWGLRAGGYLFTNLLLHLLNGLLLYRLMLGLHADRLAAAVAAALFLLHPVQVETVAWASQRKTLLAMLFFLAAWLCYNRFREAVPGAKSRLYYLAALASFVLALLSKSVAVIFPLVLILFDVCFPRGGQRFRLLDKLPFVLLSGGAVVLSLVSQMPDDNVWGGGGGRVAGYHGGSLLATLYTMLPVLCRYLVMVVFPTGLRAEYDAPIHQSLDAAVAWALCALLAVGLMQVQLFRVDRRLGFWALLFWVGLLPVSQIVPLVTLMNDRYLYFPLLGAAALIGIGTSYVCRPLEGRYLVHFRCFVVSLFILLSAASFQRVAVWNNAITFWQDAVMKNPARVSSWEKLGEAYHVLEPSNPAEAEQAYRRALQLDPSSEITLYNLGILYTQQGEFETARVFLTRLLEINPEHVMGLTALGDVEAGKGRYAEAEQAYLTAYSLQPDAVQVMRALGSLSIVMGQYGRARSWYAAIEGKGWGNGQDAYQLARVAAASGRGDEALIWLEIALQRGYRDREGMVGSQELGGVVHGPGFKRLMQTYFPE